MSVRTTAPYRAEHVGSLLRPDRLRAARAAHKAGTLDDAGLKAAEDEAVVAGIALQKEVGLRSVTDGEFRRTSWHMDFIYELAGVSQVPGERIHVAFHNEDGQYDYAPPAIHVDGRVGLDHTIFADAFTFVRDHAGAEATPKLTIPSPSMVHYRGGNSSIDRTVYPDVDEFWVDLTAAYRHELESVYALGCRHVQLDDTSLAYVNDPKQREHIAEIGGDPEHLHEGYIAHLNRVIEGRPDDLAVTVHLCRGNNQSMWAAEGGYDFVSEALFDQLEVDGYYLEFDDERSGGFDPLRFVPAGDKQVVLGLITTKKGTLESKDEIKRRIEEASRFVDIDQLCLSPQCGFSSTEEGNALTEDEQKAKLSLVVEVAAEVWGS